MYKNLGDDLIIEADFPRVFGILSFMVRLHGSLTSFLHLLNCDCQMDTLTCNCGHLTTNNIGNYDIFIHILLDTDPHGALEWFSNSVTIIVKRSKA